MKATTQKTVNFSPPGSKKRGKLKNFEYEAEPMVLMPTVPPESVAQYSISLPSTNKDKMLDEMDMLKNITEHLNEIVDTMEQVYAKPDAIKEEEEDEEEEPTADKKDYEDMTSFLISCSQLSTQLEHALREEKQILESLLKWFEKEVHEMEELGEEEIIPDWQIPVADKNITDNISKLLNRIERLEELKGRVQELPKLVQLSTPKQEKKRPLGPMPPAPKDPKNIIEELAMKHATEDVMNMVQVFQDDTGQPQTLETMNNRMVEIMKVFERQTNKLHRVANEQDVLEGKLQKVQKEFQKLAEEKEIMEDELQKMKNSEQEKMIPEARKKMLAKLDRAKVDEKPPAASAEKAPLAQIRESLPVRHKENQKMKEDLAKAQANIQSLEEEKKMLEAKLKKALEEAEMAKGHLAEIPPNIPDWQFPYTAIEEDDKDISKKGKKATKLKGKGEDRADSKRLSASGTDRTISKLQRAEMGKAGETFPGKCQDLSTAPQTRDAKQKRKGSVYPEGLGESSEKELRKQTSQAEITSQVPDKKMDESKKTKAKTEAVDSKGKTKSKESAEIKKPRSKGIAKETPLEPSVLPPIQETEQLPDSTKDDKKSLPETLEKSPPDSKRKKEITVSPELIIEEEDESLHISEEKVPPPPSKVKMEDSAKLMRSRKPLMLRKEIPGTHLEPVELGEDETRDLINERMLELADHLTELEGMPEAETVAKLLLESGQGMEELSDRQKLQLLNQLLTPVELQLAGVTEEEQTEEKRKLFANVAATLQLLQQTQTPEAGLSEEEINEMAEKRGDLLAELESTLKEAQAARPDQKDIDREINKLSEERSLLLASLESNMKELEQAQALAASQPSEMTENKVKELLQQRELLTANLEANLQELQRAKTLETGLSEKHIHEKEIDEFSKQRLVLLASLNSNLKDLEEAEALAATQPGSVSDEKIKELREQRKLLTAHLESNLQDLQRYQSYVPGLDDEGRPLEIELSALSEKRKLLQEKLDSNLKELQQAQELASLQPDSINEHILEELTKQRRHLTEDLTATVNDIQETQRRASQQVSAAKPSERELYALDGLSEKKQELLEKLESNQKELQEAQELAVAQPGSVSEREVYELSVKKQELQDKLESNQKELQEAQMLAVAHPGSFSDNKLKQLIEQRRYLATELETTMHQLQKAQDLASEGVAGLQPAERELYELSAKKQELLEKLKANQKELQEAQELAATDPGSIGEHKLQELAEQKKRLTEELEETMHDILKAERRASEHALIGRPAERELYELSVKKQVLQEKMESNLKELEEAQALAATQPGSASEHKLKELAEQKRLLSADLKATMKNIQTASKNTQLEPIERELYELSAKKQLIQAYLESNWKALQDAQAVAATQPDSLNELKLQELAQERRRLTEELKATVDNIQKAERCVLEMAQIERPIENELYELSEKKKLLLENLKGLQEAQALAATQPGSLGDLKRKQLAEQKRHLAADLEATVHDIQRKQRHASKIPVSIEPSERELSELSEKKYTLLENLASNRKELQEAQALADAQPGSVSDQKLQELADQRRCLTEELKATVHNIQEIQHHTLSGRPSEHKLQELDEQRRRLTLDQEATIPDVQDIQHYALQRVLLGIPDERELYELSEKKQMLLKSLESKQKELEEAEALAATQPGSVSAHKLQELYKQKRRLTLDLEATVRDIQEIQQFASQRAPTGRPAERELYELSEKKQMLLKNLESKQAELEEAKALAAAEPGSISEHKLQELDEQRRRLTLDLEATVHDIQEILHASQRALLGSPDERELYELSEKKQMLLESLESKKKELQEAEALAAAKPGSISEHKLQELYEQRRRLTLDLEATVHDIQEIQHHALQRALLGSPDERKLSELSDKKQKLLDSLESKKKELQEAETLAVTHPGSISVHKLQALDEQRRRLTIDLEATEHDIQEVQQRALSGTPSEKDLYELFEWKQLLLECLESNLKEFEETHALAAIQPDSISEKKIQELNEQRKILTENLKTVVQDVQKMKSFISESGGIIPFDRDLNELYKKKKLFLERLESNLKDLQAAETLAVAHPGSINEQKVQELTEQRMLLAAGLDAIIQDLQDIVGLDQDKIGSRTRERDWEELSGKKRMYLENLASNLTALKQARALAAAHRDDISEQKVQEIIKQRRRLTAGLQAIVEEMQELQDLVSGRQEKLEPSESELDELSEKRRLVLENMELNLQELKDLQDIATQPGGMSEQKMQELIEKRELLVANIEAILQDMQDAQSFDSDQRVITRPDKRQINDLLELSRLESKLDELEETHFFPDAQLDSLKRKVHKLKEQRRSLIDKWELQLLEEYPETYGLDKKAKEKVVKKILDERKKMLSYVQENIRDLQKKGIIQPDEAVQELSDVSLMMGPLSLLQLKIAALSAKYGPDDEKTRKRRSLAAKLEANIRDLQAAFQVEKIEKPSYAAKKDTSRTQLKQRVSISESSDYPHLQPTFSGLQMQITKAPGIRRIKPSAGHRKAVEFETSVVQQERKLRREIELAFKRHVLQQLPGSYYQQLPGSKTSSLLLPSPSPNELNANKFPIDTAMQELLEYNKSLLPGHRANLQQALQLAHHQLQQQQQNNILSERIRKMSVLVPQPPGTTRFHEYSTQPSRPVWEANQLPQKDYAQKLNMLRRRFLGADMKGLGGAPLSSTQGPSSLANKDQDLIAICGKGCNPFKKPGAFPDINEQLRHH